VGIIPQNIYLRSLPSAIASQLTIGAITSALGSKIAPTFSGHWLSCNNPTFMY